MPREMKEEIRNQPRVRNTSDINSKMCRYDVTVAATCAACCIQLPSKCETYGIRIVVCICNWRDQEFYSGGYGVGYVA